MIVGRFFARLSGGDPKSYGPPRWQDGWAGLAECERTDILTGRRVAAQNGKIGLAEIFRSLPVAVLVAR